MSLVQGNNTPTWPRIEPGSPDLESEALTTRPVRSPQTALWLELIFLFEPRREKTCFLHLPKQRRRSAYG